MYLSDFCVTTWISKSGSQINRETDSKSYTTCQTSISREKGGHDAEIRHHREQGHLPCVFPISKSINQDRYLLLWLVVQMTRAIQEGNETAVYHYFHTILFWNALWIIEFQCFHCIMFYIQGAELEKLLCWSMPSENLCTRYTVAINFIDFKHVTHLCINIRSDGWRRHFHPRSSARVANRDLL
jgi:hypothetical protein